MKYKCKARIELDFEFEIPAESPLNAYIEAKKVINDITFPNPKITYKDLNIVLMDTKRIEND
jgi:hypothetical protein